MASFTVDNSTRTPFGKNQYLRSTRGLGFESYTLAASTVPVQTIDGFSEKVIQPGTAMARITAAGDDQGKIGPYQPGLATNESALIALTATGGTFTLTFSAATTAPIAFNASAGDVRIALEALAGINPGEIVVTGGALPGTAVRVTFVGPLGGSNVGDISITTTNLTGGTGTVTVTQGSATPAGAATDGRQTAANLVGILETFLPWQTKYRDVEVAALYRGAVVQGWCFELGSNGAYIPLTDATRTALIARPSISLTFH